MERFIISSVAAIGGKRFFWMTRIGKCSSPLSARSASAMAGAYTLTSVQDPTDPNGEIGFVDREVLRGVIAMLIFLLGVVGHLFFG